MFKKIILLFLTLIFYACPAFAQDYVVISEALNIRSGPGTQYEVVGKLKQGDKVYVKEFVGNWAKIKTENDTAAFVNQKLIKAVKRPVRLGPILLFGILLLILYILLKRLKKILGKRFKKRCGQCKKWGAMQEYSRELMDTKDSTIVKITQTWNKDGEVTSSRENLVPATLYKYKVIEICAYCKKKRGYIYSEKREN